MRSRMIRVWNAVPSMAANRWSCGVCVRFHPSVTPPSSGLTSTVRSPLSHVRCRRPVSPARYRSRPSESAATVVPARRAIASKMSPVAESPASIPVSAGCTDPGTTPHRPGTQAAWSLTAMMQVEVPMTLTTSPRRTPAPMASQWASNAPTGIGMPARSPSLSAHAGARRPARRSEVANRPVIFLRTPDSSGSTAVRKLSGGSPPSAALHIHLWPIAQTLRGTFAGSVIPHSTAATMSQCSNAVTNRPRFPGL